MYEILIPLAGVVIGLGVALILIGSVRRPPRLSDAFAMLDGAPDEAELLVVDSESGRLQRLGWRMYQRWPGLLTASTRRRLTLAGRTEAMFVGEKVLLGMVGLGLPAVFVVFCSVLGIRVPPTLPAGFSLVLGVLGFWWPDLALRRSERRTSTDARQALLTFFDLVVIERLANRSASQAMASAAQMSDLPTFVQLRGVLDQAYLEQRAPWPDLHELSERLELPEIADMADIMRLDEQGAALAEPMRARVAELRDAQLLRDKVAAQRLSESMTIWMVVPTLVFALIFMVPPLQRLSGG